MSLLAPLFLLGLGLIALPLWLHRLQTQTPEREPFSSAMLLEASIQRVHLRKQLQFLLLLALRIALLVLLVCAFTRPVLESTTEVFGGKGTALQMLVIDTSFSMGLRGRFDAAVAAAGDIIDGLKDGEPAQIIAADQHIRILGEPGTDKDRLKSALAALQAGEARLDFGEMMSGLDGLLEKYHEPVAIHLFSDFQATGMPARFADLIPKAASQQAVQLLLHPLAGSDTANSAVESVRREQQGLQVVVRGYHTAEREQTVTLAVNGKQSEQQTGKVPAGGEAQFSFKMPELAPGDNRVEILMTPADQAPGDDRYYAVLENTPATPVLLLTANPAALPVTYLKTALETGGNSVTAVKLSELDPRVLARYKWLLLDDLGTVNAALAASLTEYLQAGGAIFSALGERSQGLNTLPVTNQAVQPLSAYGQDQFHSVARIDGSHPVLARSPGWHNVNISRAMVPQTGAADRVLITLAGGAPLLLEHRLGAGRLLLLTTSLDQSWSDLPVHSVFVTFMTETARYLGQAYSLDRQRHAGDSILLQQSGGAAGQVLDPDGNSVLSLADTHTSRNVELRRTGIYELITPDRHSLIAVNPDPRESDTTAISPELLDRWRAAGAQLPADAGVRRVQPVRIELWHGLLLLLVMIVLAESLLGNRYLKYRTGQ